MLSRGSREQGYLVFKIYGRIEVGYFRVVGFANHLTFAGMNEGTHFYHISATHGLEMLINYLERSLEVHRTAGSLHVLYQVAVSRCLPNSEMEEIPRDPEFPPARPPP